MGAVVVKVKCTPETARTIGKRLPGYYAEAACAIEILADVADDARALAHKFRSYACEPCTEAGCGLVSADVAPESCDCGCHDTARRSRRILESLLAT